MPTIPFPHNRNSPTAPEAKKKLGDRMVLSEQDASQGFKTGHMRWVLAIGFALAGVVLAVVAILSLNFP